MVLGHPEFYPRFGFTPAGALGIACEWPVSADVFMVRVLDERRMAGVTGVALYRPEFTDPFNLSRFVAAQAAEYAHALEELRASQKRSHWMWFVFPQCAGLGHSPTADRYAIRSLAEAAAYLDHPVLGPRLRECCAAVLAHTGRSAPDIFGHPDDLKLRSSMTLFSLVAAADVFDAVLRQYYGGEPDPHTLRLMQGDTWTPSS